MKYPFAKFLALVILILPLVVLPREIDGGEEPNIATPSMLGAEDAEVLQNLELLQSLDESVDLELLQELATTE